MGWNSYSWGRNGSSSGYGQWNGGGYYKRRSRSWPAQRNQKVLWCKGCGNWMFAHKGHSHCTCGEQWNREGAEAEHNDWNYDNGGYYDYKTGGADELSIDNLVSALEKVTGKDIRTVLAEHLPQPAAVEKKLETESESFAEFRKARN